MGHFTDKVAIITGGASGIGQAIGEELGRLGAQVVLVDIQEELGLAVAEGIRQAGGRADMRALDITDRGAVDAFFNGVRDSYGHLDLVFNNAGINVVGELRDISLEQWDRLIDVNLKGVIYGTHTAYEIMREQGHGHIVNTASIAGLVPLPIEGAYGATKHAVVGLSMSLRAEARALGVNVSVVCPGVIGTPMVDTGTYVNFDKDELMANAPTLYSVDRAARVILRGVRRNRGIITVTAAARILWWVQRFMPGALTMLVQPALKRLRKLRRQPALPTDTP